MIGAPSQLYGNIMLKDLIPHTFPSPLGRPTTLTHYYDANIMHATTTGRSVTCIIHLENKT